MKGRAGCWNETWWTWKGGRKLLESRAVWGHCARVNCSWPFLATRAHQCSGNSVHPHTSSSMMCPVQLPIETSDIRDWWLVALGYYYLHCALCLVVTQAICTPRCLTILLHPISNYSLCSEEKGSKLSLCMPNINPLAKSGRRLW